MLDTAADAIQSKHPINAMSAFLNGFHFYADDMGRQVEANHFCTHVTEDFHQCVIYDSNLENAKLIGIEYIVSERVFKTLPDEEKRLWHSHNYEVKSGELIAPGVPELAGHAFMESLVTTYGKTWHTWQVDRYKDFPTGIPQLMMGFVKDGQVNQQMLADRDKRFDASTATLRKDRSDIPSPTVVPGANAWQSGKTVQLTLHEVPVKNLPS
ncbi:MAG: OBAP family protein [Janthinobacterium lividum]